MDPDPMVLEVSEWVNSPPVDLAALRGRVVLIEAFQMLCPGCVSHGLPQAKRVLRAFSREEVVVLGLHTVFEHHAVTGPDALRAFVSEHRITFPVAVDQPTGRSIPATMARYSLQGTPTTLLLDKVGRLRHSILGSLDDLTLGTHIGRLLCEPGPDVPTDLEAGAGGTQPSEVCRPDGCS